MAQKFTYIIYVLFFTLALTIAAFKAGMGISSHFAAKRSNDVEKWQETHKYQRSALLFLFLALALAVAFKFGITSQQLPP